MENQETRVHLAVFFAPVLGPGMIGMWRTPCIAALGAFTVRTPSSLSWLCIASPCNFTISTFLKMVLPTYFNRNHHKEELFTWTSFGSLYLRMKWRSIWPCSSLFSSCFPSIVRVCSVVVTYNNPQHNWKTPLKTFIQDSAAQPNSRSHFRSAMKFPKSTERTLSSSGRKWETSTATWNLSSSLTTSPNAFASDCALRSSNK